MPDSLDITTFAGRVGDVFRIAPDETAVFATRLIAVTPAPGEWTAAAAGRTPFSLIFRAPPGTPLPQRIYRLHHEELGLLELFLVPIGPDADGMCYEAVFS